MTGRHAIVAARTGMLIILTGTLLMSNVADAAESAWPPLPLPKIACRGCEHCGVYLEDNPGWACHMPTLFIAAKNPDVAWHTPTQHIAWAKNPLHSYVADGLGCLTVIAHPGRWQDELLATLKGLDGMEICHGGDWSKVGGGRWDRALRARLKAGLKPIWGFAGDDTHSSRKGDRSWLAVRLGKLHERDLKAALARGGFYASTGPVITDIQVDGPTVTVRAGQKSEIRWLKAGQWCEPMRGRGTHGLQPAEATRDRGKNRCVKIDKDVTESSYRLSAADGTADAKTMFIRCVVVAGKRAAMTQPFLIRSASKLDNPYAPAGTWHKGMTHNHTDAMASTSPDRIRQYHADYAAKGHACAFETGYDYWVVPHQIFPPGRTPIVDRVEPYRVNAGRVALLTVVGRAFKDGAKLLIDGKPVAASRVDAGRMQCDSPADLPVGRHTVTVRNADGFQGTLQYAFIVQRSADVAKGWTRFAPHDSKLGSRYCYSVASDRRGGVWVATNNGLNHFDGETWTLRRKGNGGLIAETIYDLSIDADGAAWFTCFRGMGHITLDGKLTQWRSLDPLLPGKKSFPGKQINRILRVGEATYVSVFQRPGLFVLKGGKWSPVKINLPGVAKVIILDLAADEAGRLWMGSNVGLLTWDPAKGLAGWSRVHKGNSNLPENYVLRAAPDGKGKAWVGTATGQDGPIGGLCRFDGKKWTVHSPTSSPLPERRVWSVFVDSRGKVWAATAKGVACLTAAGQWRVYTAVTSGLADNMVTDVAEDSAGNMWFTTANGVSRLEASARP